MNEELRVPSFCPLCEHVMKGSKSNHTFYNHGCCSNCYIAFVEGREEKWKSGWRPTAEQVEEYYDRLH